MVGVAGSSPTTSTNRILDEIGIMVFGESHVFFQVPGREEETT